MSERKPVSLNERANRLLIDLSRSRPPKCPPLPEESKAPKVLIEGRRRLCKLSLPAEESSEHDGVDESLLDSPSPRLSRDKESSETDGVDESLFDSPSPRLSREKESSEVDGGNESSLDSPPFHVANVNNLDDGEQIRDILNDLTARLECLSVERPNKPTEVEVSEEFGSAKSSLSPGDHGGSKGNEELLVVESDCEAEAVSGEDTDGVVDVSDVDLNDAGDEGESIEMSGFGSCKGLQFRLPARISKILYPHQREGLKWLWSLHCGMTGGILGDDMGLGKTMQIASYLAGLFHSEMIKRALIVAPKTLLAHWIKELRVVGLSAKIKDYYGTNAKLRNFELECVLKAGGVLLTTYDIVRNNFRWIRGDFSGNTSGLAEEVTWDYVILDEGHIIKNPSTQRAQSLLEIPSSHRIIISGTPIQNNLKELWALFRFCCPTVLGDKNEFKERYEYKILRGNDKNASTREQHVGSVVARELRERIKPYFLRRLKSEVFSDSNSTENAKLSRKTELIIWLRLTQSQRKLYEAFLNSELVNVSVNSSPLAALTILKKICDHPLLLTKRAAEEILDGMDAMLDKGDIGLVEDMARNLAKMAHTNGYQMNDSSCKISFVLSLLENLVSDGHNVLIFSQTRKMLNLIQEAIAFEGYTFLRIDGTTKMPDREKIVNEFQSGAASILLLTSRVGGLGLTLTNADRVIVVDPAWNPSMDNQSVDRAYRIGQKKDVVVYRLMTCGTIEEKIYKMQVFKGGLFKIATEQKEQTRYFSQKDLKELFSLPEHGFDVSLTHRQLQEEHGQHQMDDYLVKHINFLEKQDVAGVSHHSLLFTKTALVPVVEDENEAIWKGNVVTRNFPTISASERPTLAEEYAVNPKSMKTSLKVSGRASSPSGVQDMEKEMQETITRLSGTLSNKAIVSRLPDKGDKLVKRIAELSSQLGEIRRQSSNEQEATDKTEVIEIEDDANKLGEVFASLNI